jgi:putative nucleotidyltransferase with HDIG domain
MQRLQRHSLAVAHAARIFANAVGRDGDLAFLAGLLHDAGKAAGLVALTDRIRNPPPFAEIFPIVDETHTATGERLAKLWRLPSEVCAAIAGHHDRPKGSDWLGVMVMLGDRAAAHAGHGGLEADRPPAATLLGAGLGLPPDRFVAVWEAAQTAITNALA